jgi:hypothetical protein
VALFFSALLLLEDLYLQRWSQSEVEPDRRLLSEADRPNPLTSISQAELMALIGRSLARRELPSPKPAVASTPVWDGRVYNFTPAAKHKLNKRRGRMRPTVGEAPQAVLWEETVASLYNETEYQYPFKGTRYREEHDRLLDLPPKMGRPTADPAALLVTLDDRDWVRACSSIQKQNKTYGSRFLREEFTVGDQEGRSGAGCEADAPGSPQREQVSNESLLRWFAVWNYLYAQRHPDVHYVWYKLLKPDQRRSYESGVPSSRYPNIYLVRRQRTQHTR